MKGTVWTLTIMLVLGITGVLYSNTAEAKNTIKECSHPIFVEKGCELVAVAGPKGVQGDKGDMGPQGPKGEKGERGAKGDTGGTGERGPRGFTGLRGEQGVAGKDGTNGIDGKDGRDGVDGRDGKDGRDGMDYFGHEYRNLRKEFSNYLAASNSIQVHLPRTRTNRVTANVLYVDSTAGVGFGYARSLDENSDLTFGVGTAGGEYVFQLGVSGEF